MTEPTPTAAETAVEDGDAYLTLTDAEDMAALGLPVAAWTAASNDTKCRALLTASDQIDALAFAGCKYDPTQARQFPRWKPRDQVFIPVEQLVAGVVNPVLIWDSDGTDAVVPAAVKRAAFLQAVSLLSSPNRMQRQEDRADGVVSQSAGGVSESYDPGRLPQTVCLAAMELLRPYVRKSGRIV